MRDEWTKRLQTRLENHEETPPQGLFADIQKEMSRRGAATSAKKRRKAAVWLWTVPAAAAVVAVGLFLANEVDKAVTATLPATGKMPPVVAAGTTESAETPAHALLAKAETPRRKRVIPQTASATGTYATEAAQTATQNEPETVKNETKSMRTAKKAAPTASAARPFLSVASSAPHKNGGTRISLGAYCGGAAGGTNSANGVMLTAGKPFGEYPKKMEGNKNATLTATSRTLHTKASHSQPIKAGVSAKLHLGGRWGVETGVEYSYLSSQFDYDNGGTAVSTEKQHLHYIGIPLKASYSLVKTKKLNIYAAAGGAVEKLVKGKSTTHYLDASGKPDMTESVSESRPQLSVSAAAGAEYTVGGNIGVYIEPGVSHHFDNNSGVENIYKKRPTNFSLSIGVRINFSKQ